MFLSSVLVFGRPSPVVGLVSMTNGKSLLLDTSYYSLRAKHSGKDRVDIS